MKIKRCSHDIHYAVDGDDHDNLRETGRLARWNAYRKHCLVVGGVNMTMEDIFALASKEVPTVSTRKEVLSGKPCIEGTRVPVYMILDAIEYSGSLDGALQSYPHLSAQQVKDAVRFSKLILECPVDNQIEAAS